MGVSNNSLIVLAAFLVLSASSALGAPITCTYNFAASKVLCNAVSAPGRFTELGSPDGKFAFIVSDGAPRILKKAGNGTGKPGVVWQHANKIAVSYGCGAVYNTWFSQGSLQLTCGGVVYARLTASDGVSAARAKTITMDNNGTVYFVSPYGRVLTRLQGGSSANPGTVAFVKVKEPKQPPTVPSGDVAPLWVTMPDTWCNGECFYELGKTGGDALGWLFLDLGRRRLVALAWPRRRSARLDIGESNITSLLFPFFP